MFEHKILFIIKGNSTGNKLGGRGGTYQFAILKPESNFVKKYRQPIAHLYGSSKLAKAHLVVLVEGVIGLICIKIKAIGR